LVCFYSHSGSSNAKPPYKLIYKVGKQIQHADKRFIPYAVIVGEEEMNDNQYSLKDLVSGEQKKVSLEELKEILK